MITPNENSKKNNPNNKTGVVIVGATGLVGTELLRILDKEAYQITVVGRSREKLQRTFPQSGLEHMTWADFEASDATHYHIILNLAGASVSRSPWTDAYKQTMLESRLSATNMCVKKCESCTTQHNIRLINASAVSAYGFYTEPFIRFTEKDRDRRVAVDTTSDGPSCTFLQDLIDQWEKAACQAEAFGSPVTLLRTGVVLDMKEGALPEMIQPFRMFVGGSIGTGQQMMSWISTEDTARILVFLIAHPEITGSVNCTAPNAVSQRHFATVLGKALGRPSFFWTPAFVIKLVMGQMGDELIVKGQHVYPEKLVEAGFQFKHATIEAYMAEHVR